MLEILNLCGNQSIAWDVRPQSQACLGWGLLLLAAIYPRLAVEGSPVMAPIHLITLQNYSHTMLRPALCECWAFEVKSSYLCDKYFMP